MNIQLEGKAFLLFARQFKALFYKNVLLSWRNKAATLMQLSSSFIFIFILFVVDQSIQAIRRETTFFSNLAHPSPHIVTSIPPCESAYYIKLPCYDFVWSGKSSSKVSTIVGNIMRNNAGRPIPLEKVIGFETTDDVDAWLLNHPMSCPGALHFQEWNSSVIAYGIQINSTRMEKRGIYEESTFKFQLPLQAAAEREITRFLLGSQESDLEWNVSFIEFAHPPIRMYSTFASGGATCFLAATMLGFVIQLKSLTTEKELKLRQAMSVMGLLDSVYWSTWLLWETLLASGASMLLILFGMMFQFSFFLNNNVGVLFFMFFLFQFNMVSFAFLCSAFLEKASSATTVGFSIFLIGFLTQLVTGFGFPYEKSFSKLAQCIWSFFPPNLLAIGLKYLGDATATAKDKGIHWAGRLECPTNNPDCVLTMVAIYKWLLSTFFLWFILAIYLDKKLPDIDCICKYWIELLYASYWIGNPDPQIEGKISRFSEDMDEDVAAEAKLAKQQHALVDHDGVIQGVSLNIEQNKLFCLLGPNGAGKTTLINCLTGILPITSGDALVYQNSVRSTRGLSIIRNIMGVCPQFDILWDALTGREHLQLFGSIKGLSLHEMEARIEALLSKTKLVHASNTRAGSYSGGMKRRLSLAVALIGDPKVVYLDEPTTGLDPVTRRHVWDIIEDAKQGRAVILTTHSMEEADVLGDRIAIMTRGRLQCLGTSIHLKSKFGTGYIASISVDNKRSATSRQQKKIKDLFKQVLNVEPKEEGTTYLTFIIPRCKEGLLGEFFENLETAKQELGISDIQLGLTTLEDVFLKISRTAELQASLANNQTEELTLENDTILKVPVGAQYVAVPDTETDEHPCGFMVEVTWQQDESGVLRFFKNTELIPRPPHITPEAVGIVVSGSARPTLPVKT